MALSNASLGMTPASLLAVALTSTMTFIAGILLCKQ
jgi:hypothetical protein